MKKLMLLAVLFAAIIFAPNILKATKSDDPGKEDPSRICKNFSHDSVQNLLKKINTQKICYLCNKFLFKKPLYEIQYLVMFKCTHFFHPDCINKYFQEEVMQTKKTIIKCPHVDCKCLINLAPSDKELRETKIDFAIIDLSVLYSFNLKKH